jgi:hypothetical protein
MDRETVEEIKRHFDETAAGHHKRFDETADDLCGHIDKTFGKFRKHFDATVEDMMRQFGTYTEGLRSDMRVVAEGQDIVRGEVRDLNDVVQRIHSELTGRVNDHERRLTTLERKPAKGR